MAHLTDRPSHARASGRQPIVAHVGAIAFALLIATGTVATVANPALSVPPTAGMLDGGWAEAYQHELDAASPLLAPSRMVWGVIDLVVFGQGRPGVLVGDDGWLYSSEEYDVVADVPGAIAAWTAAASAMADRLAAHDIELVVALVPSKAAMVPHPAPARLPEGARHRYDAALAALRAEGLVAVDVRPALAAASAHGPVYLRTDTHWTPHGAEAAAGAIAAAVQEHTAFGASGEARFSTSSVDAEPLFGDLTRFLDLGALAGRIGPRPDLVDLRTTVSAAGPGDDLFAVVRLPIALVGTSYSADSRWNFPGALREALGTDLHEAAVSGIGPLEPLERYLASEAFASTPPEVVVWEIPERYLTLAGFIPSEAGS